MDLTDYRALVSKVDAFFERVRSRHAAQMACMAGCSACCGHALTLSPVEAESVRLFVAALPPDVRTVLATRSRRTSPCPALDDNGRCAIYAARPLICRTQGLPMRLGKNALPVLQVGAADADGLSVCPLNFDGVRLGSIEGESILRVETLDTTLAVVNARAVGIERAVERLPIGDLLAGG